MINRCYYAAFSIALVSSFLIMVPLALFLQFSPLSPIASLKACYSMFNYNFFGIVLFQLLVIFAQSLMLSIWIFSVDFEMNLNIAKLECLIASGIILTGNILLTILLSFGLRESTWFSSIPLFSLWLVFSIILSVHSAYTKDFQLKFVDKRFSASELKKNYYAWIFLPAIDCALITLKLFGYAWLTTLNLALLLRPFHSSILPLITFWRFPDLLLLLFAQRSIICLTSPIVNFFVMRPIEFVLPTVFYAAAEGLNPATMTLISALESKDQIIKIFAMRQLQRICSGTPSERKPFYSLSQPGGHPRNWNALRDISIALLRNACDKLSFETHCRMLMFPDGTTNKIGTPSKHRRSIADKSLLNGSINGDSLLNSSTGSGGMLSEIYMAKQSFFVPPALNPRSTDAFLTERLQSRRLIGLPQFVGSFLEKIKLQILVPPPIVSSYDTQCILFAIKAICNVISHSLVEDEFGVVQKDLKASLSALTRLSIAIDAYVRASGRTSKSSIERNICLLDEGLALGLKQIRDVFGQHMSELDLHPTELEVFQVLT